MTEIIYRLSQGFSNFLRLRYIPVVVVCLMGWMTASFFWQVVQLFYNYNEDSAYSLFIPPVYQENLVGDSLWQWTNYNDLYIAPPQVQKPVSITLAVTLLGIISSGSKGYAMLKINNGKEGIYGVGDVLQGRAKISSIDLNSITLTQGSEKRVYRLQKKTTNIFLKNAPVPVKKAAPRPKPVKKDVKVSSLNSQDRKEIKKFEDKIISNPLAASNDFDVKEIKKNGSTFGYQLSHRINPELLRRLGLLPTDIVISVNGIPTPSIASNPQVVADLMKQKRFVIVYERQGKSQTLTVNR